MSSVDVPELGILNLVLTPIRRVCFRVSSARSLHAALLRRLELIVPELSQGLHESLPRAHSTQHPLAVSPLLGLSQCQEDATEADEGKTYVAHVAALTFEVAQMLDLAFYHRHPLGREPLMLENVPFKVVLEETYWDQLSTYASLLTTSKPQRRIAMEFCSPTGFRTRSRSPTLPSPGVCVPGYLRKWNSFAPAPITLSEEIILPFVQNHMTLGATSVRPAVHRLGRYSEYGVIGRVEWQADPGFEPLLRQVNALVDFAGYCGTGMKTALGMGQTRRLRVA